MKLFRTTAAALALTTGLLTLPAQAEEVQTGSGDPAYDIQTPKGYAMLGDLIIARPLLIGATAAWGMWLALRADASDAGLARAHATLLATRPDSLRTGIRYRLSITLTDGRTGEPFDQPDALAALLRDWRRRSGPRPRNGPSRPLRPGPSDPVWRPRPIRSSPAR